MYCQHFGLTQYPFESNLEPDELFDSQSMIEAQTRLKHLVDLKGIGLITGEVGSGKTTACRQFISSLHPSLFRSVYVTLTTGNVMDLYKSISTEVGLTVERNRAQAFRSLQDYVTRLVAESKIQPILIIDEAHHLRNEVLEDLRLLTNFAMDSQKRLCLMLVGLTEIRRRLSLTVHESLEQRIVARYHVTGLTRDETPRYLQKRVERAGSTLPLFDPNAIEALFESSNGLPRKLNRTAHYGLWVAALKKERLVRAEHIEQALNEFRN